MKGITDILPPPPSPPPPIRYCSVNEFRLMLLINDCIDFVIVNGLLICFYFTQCNKKRIVDYPNLWGFTRDLYQTPGIGETVDQEHIQKHYQVISNTSRLGYMFHPFVIHDAMSTVKSMIVCNISLKHYSKSLLLFTPLHVILFTYIM